MSLALVFPGQGSQTVGMLGQLAASFPVVKDTFDEASAALGRDLWQVVQQGPAEELNRTECTQPAMLTAGFATWRLWKQLGGPDPAQVSGHSLGEFTALACAGALGFADAVTLVRDRGRYMQEAVPAGEGALAAILGLEDVDVEAACAEAAQGAIVEAVNYNAPGQVAIAGTKAAVERAIAAAKARGAKRAVLLPVSVPVHSSLMQPAAERLRERLAAVKIAAPRFRYISSVDAQAHDDPADLRALLVRQLASPVRWTGTIRALCAAGATQLAECGPGKVLTGLNRRIERRPDLRCSALEDEASIRAAIAPPGEGNP
jgi:[acyl-carrier-protein] S-malonyltransferase